MSPTLSYLPPADRDASTTTTTMTTMTTTPPPLGLSKSRSLAAGKRRPASVDQQLLAQSLAFSSSPTTAQLWIRAQPKQAKTSHQSPPPPLHHHHQQELFEPKEEEDVEDDLDSNGNENDNDDNEDDDDDTGLHLRLFGSSLEESLSRDLLEDTLREEIDNDGDDDTATTATNSNSASSYSISSLGSDAVKEEVILLDENDLALEDDGGDTSPLSDDVLLRPKAEEEEENTPSVDPFSLSISHLSAAQKELAKQRFLRQDRDGLAALHRMAMAGDLDKLNTTSEILGKMTRDIVDVQDAYGNTALLWACRGGHLACVEALLRIGASPYIRNLCLEWPFGFAVEERKADLLEILLQRRSELRDTRPLPLYNVPQKVTLLHAACSLGYDDIIHQLLSAGESASTMDHLGHTPLVSYVMNGHHECIEEIAASDKLVGTIFDYMNRNALHWAAAVGNSVAVKKLLKSGCKPDVSDRKGSTPTMLAASNGHKDVLVMLSKPNISA